MSIDQLVETIVLRPDVITPIPDPPVPVKGQRRWLLPVAIGVAAVIASGTLGGVLWSTIGQRDAARHQLGTTQQTLAATRGELTTARANAATRKVTSDYVRLVTAEGGQAVADYGTMAVCSGYGPCRTAAQQTLTDLQAFQAHRAAATVPPELTNADGTLRDGLSAAIAAVQEFITGADNDDLGKLKDGAKKLDAALLSIGKAEAAVGAGAS